MVIHHPAVQKSCMHHARLKCIIDKSEYIFFFRLRRFKTTSDVHRVYALRLLYFIYSTRRDYDERIRSDCFRIIIHVYIKREALKGNFMSSQSVNMIKSRENCAFIILCFL